MIDEHNDSGDALDWWGGAHTDRMSLDCTLSAILAPDATIGTVAVLRFTRLPDLLCHLSHQDLLTRFVQRGCSSGSTSRSSDHRDHHHQLSIARDRH